jgi:hypothetical protein
MLLTGESAVARRQKLLAVTSVCWLTSIQGQIDARAELILVEPGSDGRSSVLAIYLASKPSHRSYDSFNWGSAQGFGCVCEVKKNS